MCSNMNEPRDSLSEVSQKTKEKDKNCILFTCAI